MKYVVTLLCVALWCSSCNDEGGTVTPTPVAASPFDWNNSEYDWAVTIVEDCKMRGYAFSSFIPHTIVRVFGATDNYLLVTVFPPPVEKGGLYRYDLATGELTLLWTYGADYAQLSPDGSTIALRGSIRTVAFLNPETGGYTVFSGSADSIDSFEGNGADVRWLPDSRSVLVYFTMKDGRRETFLLSAQPPHTLTPYSQREVLYTYFTGTRELFFNQEIRGVKTYIEERRIGDSTIISRTRMPKGFYSLGIFNGGDVSPDGQWLAAPVRANLAMTRLSHLDIMDGLGIFDLREGSPTQYQLYRFIGDHTHFECNCLSPYDIGYSMNATWSADSKYLYHERLFMSDSTMQLVRYDVAADTSGVITNFWR